jgi:hypothetical protein
VHRRTRRGYRRLENQLYRVEIHGGGSELDQITIKWSRDNGCVVVKWTGKNGDDVLVSSTGKDEVLGFAAGTWIELTDDTHELEGQPGTLVKIKQVLGNALTIDTTTATGGVDFAQFPINPKVRRWTCRPTSKHRPSTNRSTPTGGSPEDGGRSSSPQEHCAPVTIG